jgi:Ca-activated chloride channel family protein
MLPEMNTMPLEFLRPLWLLGMIVVILFSLLRYKNNKKGDHQALIAPHLSANIVSKATHSTKHQFAFNSLAAIACIALAGPTLRSIDMPVYEMEKAQVIVFDLSYSMFATDIEPSRLAQAKFKAIDLIKQWSEGEKALIAYAGDAFTVTPLTRDGNAIINHIPHLSPDIMPVTGSRADLALKKAIELLENAGYAQGHIVFISDDISKTQAKEMQEILKGERWIVSILAVATPQGAPIRLPDGSLLKNDSSEIIVPKLSGQPLYDITRASDGLYLTSRNDSSDVKQLGNYYDDVKQTRKSESDQTASDQFAIDDGYWLSFLLLPLFLLLFRKGVFFALLLAIYLPFTSPPLEAAESTEQEVIEGPLHEMAKDSIWKNSDQNAFDAYQKGQYQVASELYDTPLEQGSALYKNKQYEQAQKQFDKAIEQQPENANAFYNQGNNYAQLQQLDKAIEAYDKALAIDSSMKQAIENKKLIDKIKKQQQEQEKQKQKQKQKNDNKDQQDSDKKDSEQQDSQQNKEGGEQQDQEEGDQQDSERDKKQDEQQDSKQQKQSDQQDAEQQQKEQQQAEQNKQQQAEQAQQETQQEEEQQQAQQQLTESDKESNKELEALPNWLKNMPDDPSILLRRKMQLEYQKRAQSQPVKQKTNNGVIW